MTIDLTTTRERLEQLRAELEAHAVTAQFGTRHGVVELRAEAGRFSILVDGVEVPREEEA